MNVILWMTASLNGMIAGEHNEEDFISNDSWREWLKWLKKSGCLVFGRKTYEVVQTWDKQYIDDIKGIRIVVISENPNYPVRDGFTVATSPQEALEILKKEGFQTVIVTGGSKVNSSFAKLGLLDKVIINIEPVLVGKGIPLFNPEEFDVQLQLEKIVRVSATLIQLQYKVLK